MPVAVATIGSFDVAVPPVNVAEVEAPRPYGFAAKLRSTVQYAPVLRTYLSSNVGENEARASRSKTMTSLFGSVYFNVPRSRLIFITFACNARNAAAEKHSTVRLIVRFSSLNDAGRAPSVSTLLAHCTDCCAASGLNAVTP
jgi:hypothetical protein